MINFYALCTSTPNWRGHLYVPEIWFPGTDPTFRLNTRLPIRLNIGPSIPQKAGISWTVGRLPALKGLVIHQSSKLLCRAYVTAQAVSRCRGTSSVPGQCRWYSAFGKSLYAYKTRSSIERTITSKNWIKQLHTLPVLHFNRCLTTEYSETAAHFNGIFETDNQIYVPKPGCTATFRTHCIYGGRSGTGTDFDSSASVLSRQHRSTDTHIQFSINCRVAAFPRDLSLTPPVTIDPQPRHYTEVNTNIRNGLFYQLYPMKCPETCVFITMCHMSVTTPTAVCSHHL
jgi:hypothetical protein